MIAAVPDLVILEKARRRFFPHLHIEDEPGFLIGKRDKGVVPKEGKETDNENNQNERKGDAIEANPSRFKSGDLTRA